MTNDPHTDNCLAQEVLVGLLRNSLTQEEKFRAAEHVQTCHVCQQELETICQQRNIVPPESTSVEHEPSHGSIAEWSGKLAERLLTELQQDGPSVPTSKSADPPSMATIISTEEEPSAAEKTVERGAVDSETSVTKRYSGNASSSTELHIAEMFGRYKVEKILGQGAMGAVYLARDTQLDRDVALKIPKFGLGNNVDDQELLERFYREARAAATLRSPNICPVYDVGEIDGQHYITMAYIEGRPLKDFTKSKKKHSEKQIVTTVRKLALGLSEAHEIGVVHRDLKPANIMVDLKGEPVVMDFGLARRSSSDDVQVTQSGAIMGTPAYMSPEQVEGDQNKIGPQADIYALGIIMYELITGEMPYKGSLMSILQQIAINNPEKPSKLRPDVDPRMEQICLKMMAGDLSKRYQSMNAVASDLQEVMRTPRKMSRQQPSSNKSPQQTSIPTATEESNPALISIASQSITEQLREKRSASNSKRLTSSGSSSSGVNKNVLIAGGVGGILLLLGIIFFVRVGKYDVKITLDDPTITLSVDGETLNINNSGEVIKLSAGEHKLQLEKDGLKTHIEEFTVTKDGKTALTAKVVNGQLDALLNGEKTPQIAARSPSVTSPNEQAAWQGWPADAPPAAVAPFDAAQAKVHQQVWAKYLGEPVVTTNSIGMQLAVIPPGRFRMDNAVDVTLTKPLRLGIHEVTQGQWKSVMGAEPWKGQENVREGENIPATFMDWTESTEFCRKLTERERAAGKLGEGWQYRLPTEAEWEYACRAGTTTTYSVDDESLLGEYAWFDSNSKSAGEEHAHKVGLKKPNPWGLYDVHGNVRECCSDWYAESLRGGTDPTGPAEKTTFRVFKGGAWHFPRQDSGSAIRHAHYPDHRSHYTGLRVALCPLPGVIVDQVDSSPPNFGLAFDGVDDIVEISDFAVDASGPLTIECFITPQDPDATASIVRLYGSPGCSLYEIRGRIGCSRFDGDGQHTRSVADVSIDGRIHVAATWQGKEMTLFIDGRRVGHPNQLAQEADRSVERLFLGGQLDTHSETTPNFLWKGVLDEVRISNVVRYDADFEPTDRYASDEHTIALYHFDEGQGDILKDSSGNGHHGKIIGATRVKVGGDATSKPQVVETSTYPGKFALSFPEREESYVEVATLDSKLMDSLLRDKKMNLTIEFWLKRDQNKISPHDHYAGWSDSCLFVRSAAGSEYVDGGEWGGRGAPPVGFYDTVAPTRTLKNEAVWTHVAAVLINPTEYRLFIDGKLVDTKPAEWGWPGSVDPFQLMAQAAGMMGETRVSTTARYDKDFTPEFDFKPDEHTLALYHFDEGTGDVVKDSSGNGHHGKIIGAKWVQPAVGLTSASSEQSSLETSLHFSDPDDEVTISTLKDDTDALTIELWLQRDSTHLDAHSQIVGFDMETSIMTNFNSALDFQMPGTGGEDGPTEGWDVYGVGRPVHVAGVRDPEKKELRLYYDGKLVQTSSGEIRRGTGTLQIASNQYQWVKEGEDHSFSGWIDELRISKSVRYKEDFTPQRRFEKDNETTALYQFEEGSGDVLKDSSGNGHHGKIIGAKWVKVDGAKSVMSTRGGAGSASATPPAVAAVR
ncbi:MAG: SUMF1/EgtB/PvdO family nonheme iron enzyme [Planctomycetaceae bacterium]|nr:SUMF1/EgtB/PvdO family nonheme iron enzyme [Planctomycetaceae bacterium]